MNYSFPMVPLTEILTQRLEVPSEDAIASGEIPIIAKISFNSGSIQLRSDDQTRTGMILIRPGDIVVSGINAAKGAIAMYGEENTKPIAATIHYNSYIPNNSKVNTLYLWRFLRSNLFRDLLTEHLPGGIKTELKAKRLLPIAIPLPPLSEQNRIVARIEELAAKIEEARGLRREAVEEAEVAMNIVTYSIFNELYQHTAIRTLKETGKIVGGGTPSKANYTYWEGTIPWASPKDMKVRNLYDTEDHISDLVLRSGIASLIPKDSVLIVVRSGILRRTIPVSINRVPVTINQDMKAFMPSDDILCDFLAWWFKGKEADILANVKGGTTVQSIVWDKVIEFDICVPTLSEQHHIVTYLNNLQAKVDSLKELQSETATELDALLPSILDKAFKGEL